MYNISVKHMKNHVWYNYERSMEVFLGNGSNEEISVLLKKRHPSEKRLSLPVRITH